MLYPLIRSKKAADSKCRECNEEHGRKNNFQHVPTRAVNHATILAISAPCHQRKFAPLDSYWEPAVRHFDANSRLYLTSK